MMKSSDATTGSEPQGTVRIHDVAERAGVSVGTVSHTINHPELVKERTRVAVELAIKELGFVPNQQARVMAGATSQVIGLVVVDVVSPFFMAAAKAVERAAREAGYVVILCNSDNDPKMESQLLRVLAAQRVRGVLLTPASTLKRSRADRRPLGTPVVYLDFENSPEDCSVTVDDVEGGRLAIRHLLETGHERFAFVGRGGGVRQHQDRARGARQALTAAGLNPSTCMVELAQAGMGIQDGVAAAEHLVKMGLPTGIFCGNDMMAFGVYRGLNRAGVKVPDDVALVGYDDIDFAADWVVPLTSVRQPTDELGYRAAQLLFSHTASDPAHQHSQVVLQPELIVRASTGAGS